MSEEGTLAELGEFGLIQRITSDLGTSRHVAVGTGDDAAVVLTPDGRSVVSVDMLVEGRHFRRDWSTPIDVGRKAAAAALADLAAMGAQPVAVLVGFAAPSDLPAAWAVSCTSGLQAEVEEAGAVLVGGDVVQGPQIVVSVTVMGDLQGRAPVLRSGARPGDIVALAGRVGWAAAGLALLSRGFRSPKVLVDAQRSPRPPYAAGIAAAIAGATSMIDVSDGLVADARHVARASGVVIELDSSVLEVPEQMQATAAAYHVDPREWTLHGGEDHALLATFPAGTALPEPFMAIGRVRESADPGVDVDGVRTLETGGHEHFR
jgi:thiamine-monophosphate kinase